MIGAIRPRIYARVLGLTAHIHFVEDGELMGVAMRDPDGSMDLALRRDPARAAMRRPQVDRRPGDFTFLPRGIPHTFLVTRGPVRGLQITAPAGVDAFITEVGHPAEGPGLPEPAEPEIPRLLAASERYQNQILGPPPRLPSGEVSATDD
jgi:hypothetical protein